VRTRLAVSAATAAVTVAALLAVPAHAAPPSPDGGKPVREGWNYADRDAEAATDLAGAAAAARSGAQGAQGGADAASVLPYHGIAPKLNALQAASNRVSVEVIGQTSQGRDLYLVTVTAPERADESRRQDHWRRMIEDTPWLAARDQSLKRNYKTPMWFNGNIHGDEYEGLDGTMRVIEKLATATDAATAALLKRSRIYFTVTNNPDGRVVGQRANGNGFDINRDFATSSQPEARAMRDVGIATQPLVMLDEHGYVGPTLIEPSTAPHGQNYDYDLYIKHAYPNALGMEKAI
jgi:hypothetical protein